MSMVMITQQYLQDIADAIREKKSVSSTYYPSEMAQAIASITGEGGTPGGKITQDASGGLWFDQEEINEPSGTINITQNGTVSVYDYATASVNVSSSAPSLQTKSVNYTPSETAQASTVTADNGYYGLDKVNITIGAISSTYVGSGIPRKSSTNLSVEQDTVIVPAGYYDSEAVKTVASGTQGTPVATKGTVSNNSITVTPSVTNSQGYILGGTKTGTGVSVSASELVSDTYTVNSSGTKNIVNYASVSVPGGTEGTPTASKGTVSNHSIAVTPSVTNTGGYISGGTKTGTAVSVSASELVSGTLSISQNSTQDVTNYQYVDVSVSGGGSANISSLAITQNGTYTAPTGTDGYSPITVNVEGGSSSSDQKVIYFIDYDGTVIESYTADEWEEVTSLPANPSHTGLTAQGWNYTKPQIDSELEDVGGCVIGQMYVTSSGATELDMVFDDADYLSPSLYISYITSGGTITIDWGDNSTPYVFTTPNSSGSFSIQHTYSVIGNYTIKITVSSCTFRMMAKSSSIGSWIYDKDCNGSDRVYRNCLKEIRIGNNVSLEGGLRYYPFLKNITLPNDIVFNNANNFQYCGSLESITIPYGISTLGANLFNYCTSLKSISLPNTVTNIGSYSFNYCVNLIYLILPNSIATVNSDYLFSHCYSINPNFKFRFLDSNNKVGTSVFQDCNLETIELPNTIKSIGSKAFQNCYSLKSITIPNNTTIINTSAFYNCYSLKSITMPDIIKKIDNSAFYNCYSLKSLTIPSNTTYIGSNAFYGCRSLKSITIPSNITTINNNTFSGCFYLETIELPNTIKSIGNSAFLDCFSLKSITIPSNTTYIGTYAFSDCFSLKSLTIPSNVTTINTSAFYNCYGLENVELPNTVKRIDNYAFYNCFSLKSITIPSNTIYIGQYAFQNCYSLKSLTIPSNVTTILNNAFYNCPNILEYHLLPTTPPYLGGVAAFTGISWTNCKIYVPTASLTSYQTAQNWSSFASLMVGE